MNENKSKKIKITILDPSNQISSGLLQVSSEIFGDGIFKDHLEIFAIYNKQIVGIFSYNFVSDKKQLWSRGTAIDKAFQRKGIGDKLWKYVIEKHKPEYISSCIVSDAGNNFINKIKKKYPNITWDTW